MPVLDAAIDFFRSRWTSRFTDSCVINRTTARGTYNPTTKAYDSPTITEIYAGVCLIRPGSPGTTVFDERLETTHDYHLFLPHTATGIEPEDRVTVNVTEDPDLTALTLVVESVSADAFLTRRHVGLRLDQGGGDRG